MIDYSSTKSGKIITPCNEVFAKINCLNQQYSKVDSKISLTVSELGKCFMYLRILHYGTVNTVIIFSNYVLLFCAWKPIFLKSGHICKQIATYVHV